MKRVALTLAAAIAAATLTACGSDPAPTPPATPTPAAQMVTVQIGATGAGHVAYTDPAGPGGVTAKDVSPMDVLRVPVTVPKGSTVTVTTSRPATGGAVCQIMDATGQLELTKGTDSCSVVAS
ncbi:hypothetical protein [Amycolatopsis sp. NPDC059657]|uniref:hypothetical protein n=1 Tax=Amycolatopsis sp. NPDC059657 TaxID=3346899 RepID=UPI00366A92C1